MDRRGVEMSLNLVILIVIGLIVAAIVIYFVVKGVGSGNEDLRSCVAKRGHCVSNANDCAATDTVSTFFNQGPGCDENNAVCCIPQEKSP